MKPGELAPILEAIRDEIQVEHSLISHRMTWYVTSQSFLMTAFAIAWSNDHKAAFEHFFGYAIPIAGVVLSVLALGVIIAALVVQWNLICEQTRLIGAQEEDLREAMDAEHEKLLAHYKRITCCGRSGGSRLHWLAMVPVLVIPAMFFLLWVWAFYAGQLHN